LPVVIIAIMNSLFGRWRRLNYRAAWATLLTASYMDLIDTSDSYEPPRIRASACNVARRNRRFRFRPSSIGHSPSLSLPLYALCHAFSLVTLSQAVIGFVPARGHRFPAIAYIDQTDRNERDKQSIP